MKKRSKGPGDSLDLLLDTICNSFGGIVFIACLVMLLVQEKESVAKETKRNPMSLILDRKISLAELELNGLESVVSDASAREQISKTLTTEKTALEETVEKLRAESAGLAGFQLPTTSISDVLLNSRKKRDEQKNQLGKVQEAIKSAQQSAEISRKAIAEADGQITQKHRERYELLRFPKEGVIENPPFWIILRYNRAYLLFDDNRRENEHDIEWIKDGQGAEVRPIRDRGTEVEGVEDVISKLDPSKWYMAVCVYPDSYAAWRKFRPMALKHQFRYGLNLESPNDPLHFGSNGSTPPPLN